jgi:hypothetical protein
MQRTVKLSHLIAALASITALLLVSPALGGPSLKSLVKKEVKKQLAGKAGPQGPAGAPGAPGAAGSAVAYAHINSNGTLDAANSKNIAGVAYNSVVQYYCIDVSVPVHNAVATVEGSGASGEVRAFTGDPFTSCQPLASSDFQFITSNSAGADAARSFYVVFN